MTDLQQLLTSMRQGDKAAFEALYENLKKPLYTVILRITRAPMLAEDILQDVFVKIYLEPPATTINPRAYLYRMAYNLAIDSLRKHRACADLEEAETTIYSKFDDSCNKIDIERAFFALTEKECSIVTLHINGALKFREVAAIMEMPLGTVLWTYQKAIRKLRNLLEGAI